LSSLLGARSALSSGNARAPAPKTIIAVLPRKTPSSGKDVKPDDWDGTKGRELTGQAPESGGADTSPEPAGDSGDKANGNEKNANEK